ncbi:chromosomal replication initiator protein DnaA [candidate division WOR-3 bacterium]|uniref:Chromosomal replication initiator protein DnaA n=1 Tax=candidate division WOR-3 bacterium TaxID=2052148 RepID=A0A660SMR6_UNCW3|nr:MAG: chromosomal replication initiator protein DnaA [candidate division WOR-3 bacterium]
MREAAAAIWQKVLDRIRSRIPPESFRTWFATTKGLEMRDGTLLVEVPTAFHIDWIAKHYSEMLETIVRSTVEEEVHIAFKPLHKSGGVRPKKKVKPVIITHDGTKLQKRYTFENFVVGKSNQLAHAAALAVAEAPAEAYNPLFIYGGVGLGKTHLMQAIGNFIIASGSKAKVYYTPAENIFNELIHAIQTDTRMKFKKKYRSKDVLLIDDIQFLHGKESLQEEIFHTFNYLYDSGSQIVISSDRPPREIPTLEERLKSRFQGGLVVDIQAPDLETRIAILNRKAELEGAELPQSVAYYIANRVKSNIRELEGCLIRLLAVSSLSGREIDVDLAKEVLKDLIGDGRTVTKELILRKVAEHFSLSTEEIKSQSRVQELALARQIAMFLMRLLLGISLKEIGNFFGGKDHSTVIHACEKIDKLRRSDHDFDQKIQSIILGIKSG